MRSHCFGVLLQSIEDRHKISSVHGKKTLPIQSHNPINITTQLELTFLNGTMAFSSILSSLKTPLHTEFTFTLIYIYTIVMCYVFCGAELD